MTFLSRLFACVLLAVPCFAGAAEDPLPPEKAFQLATRTLPDGSIELTYRIAKGYYLYRDKFGFVADGDTAKLGAAQYPKGEMKKDEFFGLMETYRREARIVLPVAAGAAAPLKLDATSQGCADIGVCYPPFTHTVELTPVALAGGTGNAGNAGRLFQKTEPLVSAGTAAPAAPTADFGGRPVRGQPPGISDESRFWGVLDDGNLLAVIGFFFVAGILLAFTPCVLPMVPILSGIIVGEGRGATKVRAFALSAAYVLGMAVTYTAIGIAAALTGSLLAAALQNAWVLGAFALVFVVLAFSMFGFYDIQLPAALHNRVHHASNRFTGGQLGAVATMGALSAAIVSPCIAAPLAGALLYVSQTRDVLLGGTALFAMAIGMGVPLMAVGVTEGALLPKSGHLMKAVKKFFGFLLLGVAIWIVAPVVPAFAQMLAWAALLVIGAMFLHALDPLPHDATGYARFWKGVGVLALAAGVALVIGALAGSRDPLQPLSAFRTARDAPHGAEVRFERVRNVAELDAVLKQVRAPVMLDFYADWCVSCKEMERFTFSDPKVSRELARMVLLQADVTANTPEDKALLERFSLFGPPGIVFFDPEGREIPGLRVIGYQPAERFLGTLSQAQRP